jgi:Holliday junction resolvase RusA-like endonuclease
MATVRKRVWTTRKGVRNEAWVTTYKDIAGRVRTKHLPSEAEARKFMTAIVQSEYSQPLKKKRDGRPIMFVAPVPRDRTIEARKPITEAFRAAHPMHAPLISPVIVHVFAEIPPHIAVADVDNLLKPVLDALAGVAYVNDNQIVECLVRRLPCRERRLVIKIWPAPSF